MEILIGVGILSLVGIAMVAMISQSLTGWSSATSQEFASSGATIALQKLSNEIRDGRQATISSGNLVVSFPRTLTDGTTGQVIYDRSASDPVPRIYYVSDGNLMRSVGGVSTIVSKGISSAAFESWGGTVSITVTATEQVGRSCTEHQAAGRVALRNFRS